MVFFINLLFILLYRCDVKSLDNEIYKVMFLWIFEISVLNFWGNINNINEEVKKVKRKILKSKRFMILVDLLLFLFVIVK